MFSAATISLVVLFVFNLCKSSQSALGAAPQPSCNTVDVALRIVAFTTPNPATFSEHDNQNVVNGVALLQQGQRIPPDTMRAIYRLLSKCKYEPENLLSALYHVRSALYMSLEKYRLSSSWLITRVMEQISCTHCRSQANCNPVVKAESVFVTIPSDARDTGNLLVNTTLQANCPSQSTHSHSVVHYVSTQFLVNIVVPDNHPLPLKIDKKPPLWYFPYYLRVVVIKSGQNQYSLICMDENGTIDESKSTWKPRNLEKYLSGEEQHESNRPVLLIYSVPASNLSYFANNYQKHYKARTHVPIGNIVNDYQLSKFPKSGNSESNLYSRAHRGFNLEEDVPPSPPVVSASVARPRGKRTENRKKPISQYNALAAAIRTMAHVMHPLQNSTDVSSNTVKSAVYNVQNHFSLSETDLQHVHFTLCLGQESLLKTFEGYYYAMRAYLDDALKQMGLDNQSLSLTRLEEDYCDCSDHVKRGLARSTHFSWTTYIKPNIGSTAIIYDTVYTSVPCSYTRSPTHHYCVSYVGFPALLHIFVPIDHPLPLKISKSINMYSLFAIVGSSNEYFETVFIKGDGSVDLNKSSDLGCLYDKYIESGLQQSICRPLLLIYKLKT